jgi:hypothetical protein
LSGFAKCYNLAKITADKAARSLLLDQSVKFQAAKDGNVSESGSEEESSKDKRSHHSGGETGIANGRDPDGSDEIE